MELKLAERLKELREERGFSQGKLANAIGVDPTFISHVETGNSSVSLETLVLIADFFDVTTDYLLGRKDK